MASLRTRLFAVRDRLRDPLFLPRPEVHRGGFGGVLLVPSSAYHVDEVAPLARELRERGRRVTLMTPRVAPHAVVRRVRQLMGDEPVYAWPRAFALVPDFDAVLVFNDWGPTRILVELAKRRHVPTFAKVEGVQDFDDLDTGRSRRPYQSVDFVLAQGVHDMRCLPDQTTKIVGSSRLEACLSLPERTDWSDPPNVIINSNFTYGVLEDIRQAWLTDAIAAAQSCGGRPIVSQHPADPQLPNDIMPSRKPMADLLEREADVLVSRFSTVPLEAMARGVPFVYYNPHGERVTTFAEADDAFDVALTRSGLESAITAALASRGRARARSRNFLREHIDMDPAVSSARRSAAVITELLAEHTSVSRQKPRR